MKVTSASFLYVLIVWFIDSSRATDSSYFNYVTNSDAVVYMKDLYNKMMDEDASEMNDPTNVYSCEVKGKKKSNAASFHVDISAISAGEETLNAVFRVRYPPYLCRHDQYSDLDCTLEGVVSDQCTSSPPRLRTTRRQRPTTTPTLTKRVQIEPGQELSIDVTNLVQSWRESDQHDGCISFTVTAKQLHDRRLASMVLSHMVSLHHAPILTVYTREGTADSAGGSSQPSLPFDINPLTYNQHNINRRQAAAAELNSQTKCSLVKHYVNFKALGVANRIIAPKGVHMNYCSGRCFYPLSANNNHTVHAELQSLMHILNHSNVPPVCCSPTEYQSIAMLYFTRNRSIVLKRFYKITVQDCGCS